MASKVTKWFTPDEIKDRIDPLQDGEGIKTSMTLMDSTTQAAIERTFADAEAVTASRNAHAAMVNSLSTSWQGADTTPVHHADRGAAMVASLDAATASSQRVADRRLDAEEAHRSMVAALNAAWQP